MALYVPRPPRTRPPGESDLTTTVQLMSHVVPGNLLGLPAASVPVGYDGAGLPVGFQVYADHWGEHTALRVALAVEDALPARRQPRHFVDMLPAASPPQATAQEKDNDGEL